MPQPVEPNIKAYPLAGTNGPKLITTTLSSPPNAQTAGQRYAAGSICIVQGTGFGEACDVYVLKNQSGTPGANPANRWAKLIDAKAEILYLTDYEGNSHQLTVDPNGILYIDGNVVGAQTNPV